MKVAFTKMQGAGNDFVVIDATRADALIPEREERRHIAHRRLGVGCDQLLVIAPSRGRGDFHYRIFNADGGEVEQCGNGARCVAKFVHEKGLSAKRQLVLDSAGGLLETELLDDGDVRVNMGAPKLAPAEIPFEAETEALTYAIDLEGETLEIGAVSMGNPHAIIAVNDVDMTPVADLGEMLESHPRFPRRANVNFLQRVDASRARLRVFERGVGETLACGTGACASVVWGILADQFERDVHVELPGGTLVVSWRGRGQPVFLAGPAITVFEGTITL